MFKVVSPGPIIFDMCPVKYTFKVHARSSDQLSFVVPGFFIIGPRNDEKGLMKYATFMSARHMSANHVKKLVSDVIESEILVAAASMTMEEINGCVKQFKQRVFVEVQLELDQFGLQVYNANVKQLVEVPWYDARHGWRRLIKLLPAISCV